MKGRLSFVNKVIIYLTTSDVFTWGLMVVVNAFAGIYLEAKLGVDAIRIIGIGTAVYSLTNGLLQIPVGWLIDYFKTDRDDIYVLFLGNLFMGLPFLFYPTISSQYTYFFLQVILGVGTAMNLVSWRKTFAKNLEKDKEGLEYGVYQTIMSISMAVFSFAAGFIANISQNYFDGVMVGIGVIMILSGGIVLSIFKISNRSK